MADTIALILILIGIGWAFYERSKLTNKIKPAKYSNVKYRN